MIRRYFNKSELNNLLTSNYYSVLYYNSDIWLIPSLKPQLFQQLLSALASAHKMISFTYDHLVSFDQIHSLLNRATPKMFMAYKHALMLYRISNDTNHSNEWLSLNFQLNFNSRDQSVKVVDTSRLKIGKNIAVNRIKIINGKIMHAWMNLTYKTYKLKCKALFL